MKKILYLIVGVIIGILTYFWFIEPQDAIVYNHCFCTHDSIAETDSCIIIQCSTTKELFLINKDDYAEE